MIYTLYFDIYTSLICKILTSGLLPSTVSKNGVLSNSKARSTTSSPAPVPTCQNANLEKRERTCSERSRGTLPWFLHFSLLAPSTPALENQRQGDFEVEEQA